MHCSVTYEDYKDQILIKIKYSWSVKNTLLLKKKNLGSAVTHTCSFDKQVPADIGETHRITGGIFEGSQIGKYAFTSTLEYPPLWGLVDKLLKPELRA